MNCTAAYGALMPHARLSVHRSIYEAAETAIAIADLRWPSARKVCASRSRCPDLLRVLGVVPDVRRVW